MDFPLRVLRPGDNVVRPAIVDRLGRVVAFIPPGRNIWEWSDYDAQEIVDAANASQSIVNDDSQAVGT